MDEKLFKQYWRTSTTTGENVYRFCLTGKGKCGQVERLGVVSEKYKIGDTRFWKLCEVKPIDLGAGDVVYIPLNNCFRVKSSSLEHLKRIQEGK